MKFDTSAEALATVNFGQHFLSESSHWCNGDVKNFRTTFITCEESPQEMVVTLVGEIAQEGCELGACGNAYVRTNNKIVDKTNVRDLLVLVCPTMATASLSVLYENQLSTLESLFDIPLPVPMVSALDSIPLMLHLTPIDRPIELPVGLTQQAIRGPPSPLSYLRSIRSVQLFWITLTIAQCMQ